MRAWAQAGPLPPVRIADRQLEDVTCIRMDATVVPAHSDKELAQADRSTKTEPERAVSPDHESAPGA